MDNCASSATAQERRILIVDADEIFGQILQDILGSTYKLVRVLTIDGGVARLEEFDPDVVLLNLDLPKPGSIGRCAPLLRAANERPIAPPILAYSWDTRRETAIEAFEQGVADYLVQPLDVRELKFALDGAYRRTMLSRDLAAAQEMIRPARAGGLLGNSKPMERANEIICKVARVATTVLITGESGTGKGVAAGAIHRLSKRANRPFIAFSPSALPESLIEDELFGHEKGAFTGANQVRRGRFEEADHGTIFLDEIGDLTPAMQSKLLRVLQERTVERLGSSVLHPVDVRVICATSRNLEKMVQEGTFREDLFFRISVVRIHMPPLRLRTEDIPVLAEYFLRSLVRAHGMKVRGFTPRFLTSLGGYPWPGNVRELQNVIERSLVLANGNTHLGVEDLPEEIMPMPQVELPTGQSGSFPEAVRVFKRELVRSALQMCKGNRLHAARELRISRCYLHRLLNQLQINDPVELEDASDVAEVERPRKTHGVAVEFDRARLGSQWA